MGHGGDLARRHPRHHRRDAGRRNTNVEAKAVELKIRGKAAAVDAMHARAAHGVHRGAVIESGLAQAIQRQYEATPMADKIGHRRTHLPPRRGGRKPAIASA